MPKTKKVEKLSITLPIKLVSELRASAPRGGVSALVTEGMEFYLAWRRQRIALEKSFGAWKDEDHPDLKTPEDTIKYVRSLREVDLEREERLVRLKDSSGK